MNNFDWTKFTKRIFIQADIKLIYDAWTKPAELEKWFLAQANFTKKSGEKIQPNVTISSNCNYDWHWFAQNYSEKGQVYEANGTNVIEFSFAGQCRVRVELIQHPNQVEVKLIQDEIPTDDASKEGIRLGCAFGWSFYLLNLKSYCEGGIDLRNKNTELKGVVNN